MLAPIQHIETQRQSPANVNHACRPEPKKPVALQVVSSYSSFVPNQVFGDGKKDECRPFEVLTYAVVQYLSFHSIKCSVRNISKNVNLSASAIKKALCSLRKRRFIVKQPDGSYLFANLNLNASAAPVDARKVVRLHLGYWFPVDVLKSQRINNQAKRAFAVILSLTKSGQSKIEMSYIAKKLDLSREKTSPLVGCLLDERLISRRRNHCRSVYFYQIGEKAMSIYKKDLSTTRGYNRSNSNQVYKKGTPGVTSKGTPGVTPFSNKESNISIRDKRRDKRESDTCRAGENKNISFWKEEKRRLDVQYTQACNDSDWERMIKIGADLSTVERELS